MGHAPEMLAVLHHTVLGLLARQGVTNVAEARRVFAYQVSDVDKALEFYLCIPGTEMVYHRKGKYAILAIGKGQLGLVSRPVPTHVEIDVPDPDALYEQLKKAGLPVTEPPEAKGWGDYTFVMYDPDGNCLEFSRPRNVSAGSWT